MGQGYNRMSSQKARNDSALERVLGEFTLENFWRKLDPKAERVENRELQIMGVDVRCGASRIDEKCKYRDSSTGQFMKELLKFPSFECSMVNQAGEVQVGWFLNKRNITTHYAFIQPFSSQPNPSKFTIGDLTLLNILLVRKEGLDQAKKEIGEDLYQLSNRLRDSFPSTNQRRLQFPGRRPYWMTYTPTFHERPVNLVCTRDYLKTLNGSAEFEVFPNGTVRRI